MKIVWELSRDGSLRLELPQPLQWRSFKESSKSFDALQALRDVCEIHPVGPALSKCIVEGDSVAIAIDPRIPYPLEILEPLTDFLNEIGVASEQISIVLDASQSKFFERLPEGRINNCQAFLHVPESNENLTYLAADDQANPIYVNRSLCDADVVLPVVADFDEESFAYSGKAGILPFFVDLATQNRWRSLGGEENLVTSAIRENSADEIAWLLGCLFTLRVRTEAFGKLQGIEFGMLNFDASTKKKAAASIDHSDEFELVVAAIDIDPIRQTWDDVCQAIVNATKLLKSQGTIAIVSQLSVKPTSGLRMLADQEDEDLLREKIRKSNRPEKVQAGFLLEIRKSHRVLLMSELQREQVEAMGLGVIENETELQRLVAGFVSVCYVSSAQSRLAPESSLQLS